MEPLDCTWCGSARSIEYGVCQVCLMRFPEVEDVVEDVVVLREPSEGIEIVQETAEPDAADTAVAE